MKEIECKTCKKSFEAKNEYVEYCSVPCFKVYIDSDEFDAELCKAMNIE